MAISNDIDSLTACIGKKIIGCLKNEIKTFNGYGTHTFLFDDGTGFTFSGNGAFWVESVDEVNKVRERIKHGKVYVCYVLDEDALEKGL